MQIKIKIARLGKLKNAYFSYEKFNVTAENVEGLINELVAFNVSEYNAKRNDEIIFMKEEAGSVTFGGIKNRRKVDTKIMQDEAIFQFKNRLYKIVNETKKREYKTLDETLELTESDTLVFIKLALISGRWF
jgi:hypothetical protein